MTDRLFGPRSNDDGAHLDDHVEKGDRRGTDPGRIENLRQSRAARQERSVTSAGRSRRRGGSC